MNAITPQPDLLASTAMSAPTRESIELLYTPAESIFAAAAPEMVENGWSVFPQEVCRRPGRVYRATIRWSEDHDLKNVPPTPEAMELWTLHCATLNVACVMGKASGGVFALDLDIYDEAMSEEIRLIAYDSLGYTPLQRVGQEPKRAMFYRMADIESLPNRKYDVLDAETGKPTEHAIEIQGHGKLMTFYGRHHKTGRYYTWGDQNPQIVGPEAATEVTSDMLSDFIEKVSDRFTLRAGSGRAGAHYEHGIYGAHELTGKLIEGEVANDGRNAILQSVLCKTLLSVDPEFWAANEAAGEGWVEFRKSKVEAVADGFAFGAGGKKPTPPCARTGRWAPHLLLQEIGLRFDSRVAYLLKEGKPAENKMRKPKSARAAADNGDTSKRSDAVRRDARKAVEAARREGDTRPVIRIETGDITSTVDAAEKALIARGDIYQRGGRIVFIGQVPVKAYDATDVIASKIIEREDYALKEDMTAAAIWESYEGRVHDYTRGNAPMDIVKTLQQRVGRWNFPVLTGFTNSPTMRKDCSLLNQEGYDVRTGLVYDAQGKTFPAIPDSPTKPQADAALAKLRKLVSTFPFVGKVDGVDNATVDEAVVLAMMLTACVRRNLPEAPFFAISATTPGSGKSKLAAIAGIMATGKKPSVMQQAPKIDETEKRIAGFLLSGAPQIAVDNVNTPVDGDLINSMLTDEITAVRNFGTQNISELPTNSLLTFTGNNLIFIGDLTRRGVQCRLDAQCERPESRSFGNDPVEDALEQRADLVVAALTIMRGYVAAGRPKQAGRVIGGFAKWESMVRDALMWVGVADPVVSQDVLRSLDPKLDGMNNVLTQWAAHFGDMKMTVNEIIAAATDTKFENGRTEDLRKPLRDALTAVAGNGGTINPNSFGRWLLGHQGRIVQDARIIRAGDRAKVALWKMEFLNGRVAAKPSLEIDNKRAAKAKERMTSRAAWEQSEAERKAHADAANLKANNERVSKAEPWAGGMPEGSGWSTIS